MSTDFDAIIIGGGPAGSTAASLIAMEGKHVLLLEREVFPRTHVGESLLPASLPIFDALGIREKISNAGFVEKYGAAMVWGNTREIWSWLFAETKGPYEHSYQVTRPEFDQILLENAASKGAIVKENCQVIRPLVDDTDTVTGVEYFDEQQNLQTASAAITIDASGQQTLFANFFGLKNWDNDFRHLALYGYYTGGDHLQPPDQGSILIESYENGWAWKIPLHTGKSSVGLVLDEAWGQKKIKQFGTDALFADEIDKLVEIKSLLNSATFDGETILIKDWSYLTKQMTGDGYILVGDAACFIDPLFSSGVHLALQGGVLAAAYAVTLLEDPQLARSAARQYEATYRRRYGYFHELARLFYGSNSSLKSQFWTERTISADDWSTQSREEFVNIVAGNSPEGYERVVIEQGHAPETFVTAIQTAEIERVNRAAKSQDLNNQQLVEGIPQLVEGARLVKGAVLGSHKYELGYLLQTDQRPEGYPVITPIALLLNLCDGKRTVEQIAGEMEDHLSPDGEEIVTMVVEAVRNLLADGLVHLAAD